MSDGFRRREDERTPMTKDELKRRVWEAVDRRRAEIIGLGEQIRRHPELGFKEVRTARSEEHTSELQSQSNLVCRLLLEKKKMEMGLRRVASCRRSECIARHPSAVTLWPRAL